MTLEEGIRRFENYSKCIQQTLISKEEAENVCDWLRELQAYRDIIDTADERINNTYGVVIVEGYADVFDNLKEVRDGGKR